jgi:hypothetical protein
VIVYPSSKPGEPPTILSLGNHVNELPLNEALKDVADDALTNALGDLRKIPTFIGRKLEPSSRLAQSVVVRSEGILFGISTPRFAVRVYLEGGGFFNCRRLKEFAKNAYYDGVTEWGEQYPRQHLLPGQAILELEGTPDTGALNIASVLEGRSCIADSLLPAPERLGKYGFYYMDTSQARLFEAYCEPRSAHSGARQYLPYVKSIDFGGGLCAQAVCFMASIALANHSGRICGLAEITSYAHSDESVEISLSGLTPEQMQRYFSRIGLNLSQQAPSKGIKKGLNSQEKREFAAALKSYLRSDMPVILPVDFYKCATVPSMDKSIYAQNGRPMSRALLSPDTAHAVILFGFSGKEDAFIINDPSVLPFMTASADELVKVGCTLRVTEPELIDNGLFMPVTPAAVKLPLLWERGTDSTGVAQSRVGLWSISKTVRLFPNRLFSIETNALSRTPPFRLANATLTEKDLDEVPVEMRSAFAKKLSECVTALQRIGGNSRQRWIWFEQHTNSIWLWDAEMSAPVEDLPESLEGCLAFLLAVVFTSKRIEANPDVQAILLNL